MLKTALDETITSWGKSMFGGYYAEYITEDGKRDGVHADTIGELCWKLNTTKSDLVGKVSRFDNI